MKQIRILIISSILGFTSFACSSEVAPTNTAEAEPAAPATAITEITDPDLALAEGNRLLDENQTEAAIAAYRHALALNPDLADAHFQLGIAYGLLDLQNQQAGIVTEQPTNKKGEALPKTRAEKAFEKAVEAYKKRIDANENDDAAYFSLGRTYVKILEDDEAAKAFKQAVKLKPEDSEYQTELGAILIRLAQYAEAIGPLKKAVELDPSNARAEELLEDAKAGRQRIDYALANRNANQSVSNKSSSSNANTSANSNSNSAAKPPDSNARPRREPTPERKSTPRPERPRVVG